MNKDTLGEFDQLVDPSYAAEHSVIQNAIGELRGISHPALRLVVSEYLVDEVKRAGDDALDEVIEATRQQQMQQE